jgi:hypothetical protein
MQVEITSYGDVARRYMTVPIESVRFTEPEDDSRIIAGVSRTGHVMSWSLPDADPITDVLDWADIYAHNELPDQDSPTITDTATAGDRVV